MQSFTCEHCGKTVECEDGALIAVCTHCGTEQAVPSPSTNEVFFIMPDGAQTQQYKEFYEGVFGEDEAENEAYWEQVAQTNRMFMLLADGEWKAADTLCEKLLAENPQNAEACLGKLMISLKVKQKEQLADLDTPFDTHPQYLALLACKDEAVTQEVQSYLNAIIAKKDDAQLFSVQYEEACRTMQLAYTEKSYLKAAALFEKLGNFKDAPALREKCLKMAEQSHIEESYTFAKSMLTSRNAHDLEAAIIALESIPDYKDAAALSRALQQKKEMLQQSRLQKAQLAEQKIIEKERLEQKKYQKRKILIAALSSLLAVTLIAAITLYFTVFLPRQNYEKALAALEAGDTVSAYETLLTLGKYKDSADLAQSLYEDYKTAKLAVAKVGDSVVFGACDQNNKPADGKEEIEWLVADCQDNRLLLLSKYALFCRSYHETGEAAVWENCSIRKWLNSDFITECFDEEQAKKILESTVTADPNPDYDTNPGNATKDKVFLLSIEEVNRYFPDKESRICTPTLSAAEKGSKVDDATGNTWWCLRTPGCEEIYVSYINIDGSAGTFGGIVNAPNASVRPAMWIER